MALKLNRNFNINRIVKRLVYTVLALYVGGTVISTFGNVMNGTNSPFYDGLSLVGWTVEDVTNATPSTTACAINTCTNDVCSTIPNCITDTGGSGVLAVVGIIGIASVVMEFIRF